jgi:hypothetical protein
MTKVIGAFVILVSDLIRHSDFGFRVSSPAHLASTAASG